jgi:two-component system sensor histidine kinase KdpD
MRYLLALGLIAVTTAVLFAMRDLLHTSLVALLYLLVVGVSTTIWGLGPGITVALCAFLTFNYFFIQPYYTFVVHQPIDLVILLVFFIVAVVISQLVGRAKLGLAAATAREQEATQLYELSMALAGLHNDRKIANILAEKIQAMFQGDHVSLNVNGASPIALHLPDRAHAPSGQPDLVVPIQAARGVMGDIRLWRATPAISSSEKRLLQTFASQGALALERARLAEAESRAKVLEESDRLKSALLSSVSHQLRTPLSTIKASVTSLLSGEVNWDSAAREDLLAAIDEEADHLNMVVGNLLDMSRLESGALKPRRQWNILSEIAGSVAARMRRFAGNHQLEIEIPEDLPLVPVDYTLMEQVFTNLLSNSFKYAPAGTMIRVHAQTQDSAYVHVQVSNQGPQVPEEHLARIFDKFYRITDAERVTGTGLGLSICKGIIEAHGGRIWAENLPDGFAFNFTLPIELDGTPPPRLPEPEEA